jgi:hypothetical protein
MYQEWSMNVTTHPIGTFDGLVPNVRLLLQEGASDPDRVRISGGTTSPLFHLDRSEYAEDAVVPLPEWRPLVSAELASLIGNEQTPGRGRWISVVTMPTDYLEPFTRLRSDSRLLRNIHELKATLGNPTYNAARSHLLEYLVQFYEDFPDIQAAGGIHVNPPNLPTTTTDPKTGRFVGLHLDNWYHAHLTHRDQSPNRVCINLGDAPRFFLFLNLPIDQIQQAVMQKLGDEAPSTATGTARAFMRLFPKYPALRLKINPGEAYIAPTENIPHDGSSADGSCLDVSLSIRGSFCAKKRQLPRITKKRRDE